MAKYNEILVGRYNRLLQRLLGMKGGSPAPQLSSEIFPVIVLEEDRAEFEYLTGGSLMGGTTHIAASVGNINQIQLFNPVGSGALIVVEEILPTLLTADRVIFLIQNTALATFQVSGLPRDTRIGVVAGRGVGQIRTNQPAALTGARIGEAYIPAANSQYAFRSKIVLGPGTGVHYATLGANQESGCGFQWRERAIEDSET